MPGLCVLEYVVGAWEEMVGFLGVLPYNYGPWKYYGITLPHNFYHLVMPTVFPLLFIMDSAAILRCATSRDYRNHWIFTNPPLSNHHVIQIERAAHQSGVDIIIMMCMAPILMSVKYACLPAPIVISLLLCLLVTDGVFLQMWRRCAGLLLLQSAFYKIIFQSNI